MRRINHTHPRRGIARTVVTLAVIVSAFATAFVSSAQADAILYGTSGTPGSVGDLTASCSPGVVTALAPDIGAVRTPNWVWNGDGTYTYNLDFVGPNEQWVAFRAQLFRLDGSGWTYIRSGNWQGATVPEVNTAAMGAPQWWQDPSTGGLWWGATQFSNLRTDLRYGVRYDIWWYPSSYTPSYSHAFAFDSNPCAY